MSKTLIKWAAFCFGCFLGGAILGWIVVWLSWFATLLPWPVFK